MVNFYNEDPAFHVLCISVLFNLRKQKRMIRIFLNKKTAWHETGFNYDTPSKVSGLEIIVCLFIRLMCSCCTILELNTMKPIKLATQVMIFVEPQKLYRTPFPVNFTLLFYFYGPHCTHSSSASLSFTARHNPIHFISKLGPIFKSGPL